MEKHPRERVPDRQKARSGRVESASPKKPYSFSVVVIGDSTVGKTSLAEEYVNRSFNMQHSATVGIEFFVKNIIINDRLVTLQIWDTSGQEMFHAICASYYRGADCCVLVYDVTNSKSFKSLESWRDDFLINNNPQYEPENFPFIVVGNKTDLDKTRKVTTKQAQAWCSSRNNMPYFETSAKEAVNIEKTFEALALKAVLRAESMPVNAICDNSDRICLPAVPVQQQGNARPKKKKRTCC